MFEAAKNFLIEKFEASETLPPYAVPVIEQVADYAAICGSDPCYPQNENCAFVLRLVGERGALRMAVASDENLAATVLPHLLMIASDTIDLSPIDVTTTAMVVEALSVAAELSFLQQKQTVFSEKMQNLFSKLDLASLARNCLNLSLFEAAYFYSELGVRQSFEAGMGSNTITSLFAPPPPLLALLLESMGALGVRINSLAVSLHPSVRAQVAKLRGDSVGLLFENVDEGLAAMGVVGGVWAKAKSGGSAALLAEIKASLVDISAARIWRFHQWLSQPFPPALHDSVIQMAAALTSSARRAGFAHQARIIGDWAASTLISPTTLPATKLQLLHALARALWDLSLVHEATVLMTAIAHSPESSRTDDPEVRTMLPKILSRAGLWLGELRLEAVDVIREKYFAKVGCILVEPKSRLFRPSPLRQT